jgi:hypothetical protein
VSAASDDGAPRDAPGPHRLMLRGVPGQVKLSYRLRDPG